ncbi:hypothetical protein [Streptomyces sp. NPDC002851]
MLRVHFTAADLARTRVSEGADPLWEIVLSLHRLQERRPDPTLAAWRKHTVGRGPEPLRMLLPLVPPRGYFPDFLTPPAAAAGVEHGLEAVMSTPRRRLRAELTTLAADHDLPSWTRALADGEPATLRRLARGLRAYHHRALGPHWPRIGRRIDADRALRLHALWHGGAEAMLRTYGPEMRWQPPVLEVDYPVDRELHLEGRGLLLVPSYYCRAPVAFADPSLPPTLVYPASGDLVERAYGGVRGGTQEDAYGDGYEGVYRGGYGGVYGGVYGDAYGRRSETAAPPGAPRHLAPILGLTRSPGPPA